MAKKKHSADWMLARVREDTLVRNLKSKVFKSY